MSFQIYRGHITMKIPFVDVNNRVLHENSLNSVSMRISKDDNMLTTTILAAFLFY